MLVFLVLAMDDLDTDLQHHHQHHHDHHHVKRFVVGVAFTSASAALHNFKGAISAGRLMRKQFLMGTTYRIRHRTSKPIAMARVPSEGV